MIVRHGDPDWLDPSPDDYCNASMPGEPWRCTRPPEHDGDHATHGILPSGAWVQTGRWPR